MNTLRILLVDDESDWMAIVLEKIAGMDYTEIEENRTHANGVREKISNRIDAKSAIEAEVAVTPADGVREVKFRRIDGNNCVVVSHTHTHSVTRRLLEKEFFHIALVDLRLYVLDNKGRKIQRPDGVEVLKDLARIRPTCRRIMTTANYWEESFRLDILGSFKPSNRLAESLILKKDFGPAIECIIKEFERDWLRTPLGVAGLQRVVQSLKTRSGISWGSDDSKSDSESRETAGKEPTPASPQIQVLAIPTEDEVDYLISSVFGQGSRMWHVPEEGDNESEEAKKLRKLYQRLASPTSEDVTSIDLNPVGEGLSSSPVMFATPELKNGSKGVSCFVKLGPVNEVREEFRRFCRFVRFRKSKERRVELFGYEEGDTLGVLCLSNAGDGEDLQPPNLSTLMQQQSPDVIACLRTLHDPDRQDWYATKGSPTSLIAYRDEAYPLKKWDAIPFWVRDNLVKKEADIFKVPLNGPFAQMESVTLGIPENIFADAVFHRNWPTCIVHGDMHGGNIIVSRGTRPILIDYRNVGVGPRCMDYAALEASIRLSVPESEGPDRAPDIVRWTKHEKETLRHVWQGNAPHPNSSPTYWQTVSTELGLLARANFRRRKPEDAPDLELQEYVATCILWCLRIIQNTKFTSLQKRRLLIWMSELYQCLSRPGKLIADRGH